MELVVVRHAIAYERDFRRWRDDDLRPLTPAGIRRFRKVARGLRTLDLRPDRVLTSPLVRARQTAELLEWSAGWPAAAESEVLRPSARPKSVLQRLRQYSVSRVAVVGHEPSLSNLISACLSRGAARVEMKKGGVALLTFAGKPREGRGRLKWLLPPRVLRRMAGK